jgi:hypothetical protein
MDWTAITPPTLFPGQRRKRKNKYNAHKVELDGMTFASKLEARRYQVLCDLQQNGQISNLLMQVRFDLNVNGQKICAYIADFQYTEDGQTVVEDAKGRKTKEYQIKKKLMLACYGIAIKETYATNKRRKSHGK